MGARSCDTCRRRGGGGLFSTLITMAGWTFIWSIVDHPTFTIPNSMKNALYRNNGDGTFVDVTDKAGVACGQMGHFGMGAAAADYDGDGWQDLYVTNYGANVLFHNNGNGTLRT